MMDIKKKGRSLHNVGHIVSIVDGDVVVKEGVLVRIRTIVRTIVHQGLCNLRRAHSYHTLIPREITAAC